MACSVGTRGAAPRDAGVDHSSLAGLGVISITTPRSHGVIVLVNIHVKALGLELLKGSGPSTPDIKKTPSMRALSASQELDLAETFRSLLSFFFR